MSGYDMIMAPLEKLFLAEIRRKIMGQARGKVLEIAFGPGANMKYYNFNKISSLQALDVSEKMRVFDHVTYHVSTAETLSFPDESFDTVVMTLALCTIPDQEAAIREIKRVLKDDGIYIFLEHEQSKSRMFAKFLSFINPAWRRMAGGCQLILESHKNIEAAGFALSHERQGVFHYGIAQKKPNKS